jgi:hypothetical protein
MQYHQLVAEIGTLSPRIARIILKKNVVANGNTTLPLDDAIDKDNYHHIFYNHGFLSPSHFPCGQLEPYVLLKYKHYTSLAVSIIFVSFFSTCVMLKFNQWGLASGCFAWTDA